jgi:hypothetical protein
LNMWPRARKWRRRRRQREINGHELTAGEGPSTAERDRDTDPNDTLGAQKLFQPRPAWGAPVDTSSAVGRAFYGMLVVFAAFETDVRRERQLECIAMAKREAKVASHASKRQRVQELFSQDLGPAAIARDLSVYQLLTTRSPQPRAA